MTPPLFLVSDLGAGDTIELSGEQAHHAAVVKRLGRGEVVLLADGRGGVARTQVISASRDLVICGVFERWYEPEPEPRLVVVQALPKGDRADLAVEILTELGVDEIVPWSASRSVSIWRADKVERGLAKWRRTALEASKQSRRARVPEIAALADTDAVLARIRASAGAYVLDEGAVDALAALTAITAGEVLVVVGPEGGISADELQAFAAAGALTGRLGPEVMRTSTAGAAALAVLSVSLGRWR